MVGTVTVTRDPRRAPNEGKLVERVVIDWTSNGSGNASLAVENLYGWLIKVVTDPSAIDVTEVQTITFNNVPDAGDFKLTYGAETTNVIAFSDNAATVQTELRLLTGLSSVTVSGNFTTGFVVTFAGVTGNASALTITGNTLTKALAAVTVTVTETTPGDNQIPSDNYDVTLVDENSYDVLESAGLNRDLTNTESFYTVAAGAQTPVFLCGTNTITVANAGSGKSGRVCLYIVENLG